MQKDSWGGSKGRGCGRQRRSFAVRVRCPCRPGQKRGIWQWGHLSDRSQGFCFLRSPLATAAVLLRLRAAATQVERSPFRRRSRPTWAEPVLPSLHN